MIQATIFGILGADAEVKVNKEKGTQFVTFTLYSRNHITKESQSVRVVSPHIILAQWMKKGRQVMACGDLEMKEWEGRHYLLMHSTCVELGKGDRSDQNETSNQEIF